MTTTYSTQMTTMTRPMATELPNGMQTMLLNENLARSRSLQAEREAHQRRLVRQLAAARRWNRLAAWASRRSARVVDAL